MMRIVICVSCVLVVSYAQVCGKAINDAQTCVDNQAKTIFANDKPLISLRTMLDACAKSKKCFTDNGCTLPADFASMEQAMFTVSLDDLYEEYDDGPMKVFLSKMALKQEQRVEAVFDEKSALAELKCVALTGDMYKDAMKQCIAKADANLTDLTIPNMPVVASLDDVWQFGYLTRISGAFWRYSENVSPEAEYAGWDMVATGSLMVVNAAANTSVCTPEAFVKVRQCATAMAETIIPVAKRTETDMAMLFQKLDRKNAMCAKYDECTKGLTPTCKASAKQLPSTACDCLEQSYTEKYADIVATMSDCLKKEGVDVGNNINARLANMAESMTQAICPKDSDDLEEEEYCKTPGLGNVATGDDDDYDGDDHDNEDGDDKKKK